MDIFVARRVSRTNPCLEIANDWLLRVLLRRAKGFNRVRAHPIAVFGNDLIGAKVFLEGVYEKEEIEDLFAILSGLGLDATKMTVADIGANIGNHSVQFSRKFNRVLAFEPNPRTHEILVANTKRLGNVEVFDYGLGRKRSKLELREQWDNLGESTAVHDTAADNVFSINVVPLDEISDSVGKIDVMKIDVEGMEMDVLAGAENLIAKDHPIICLEQHSGDFSDGFSETEALDWLRQRGYRMIALDEYRLRKWVNRRLIRIFKFLFRRKRTVIEYKKLRTAKYNMIYAIHESSL